MIKLLLLGSLFLGTSNCAESDSDPEFECSEVAGALDSGIALHAVKPAYVETAFCRAIDASDYPMIELLLARDRDPNGAVVGSLCSRINGVVYRGNQRILSCIVHHVCRNNDDLFFKQLINEDLHGLHQSIERGTSIDSEEPHLKMTPLCIASSLGNVDLVRFCLKEGADPNARCLEGNYFPLALAARFGHVEIAKMLIKAGADILKISFRGSSLRLACISRSHDIVRLLLQSGAPITEREEYRNVGTTESPLFIALRAADAVLVELLLQAGANPNCLDGQHHCALLRAADANQTAIAQLLIHYGADVNLTSNFNWEIPLNTAIIKGNSTLVKSLLEAGAYLNATNRCGLATFQSATPNRRIDILKLLLMYGVHPEDFPKDFSQGYSEDEKNLLSEMRLFLDNPEVLPVKSPALVAFYERFLKFESYEDKLKRYLLWAITYKKEAAYEAIKRIKPQWFVRPTVVSQLLIHAAKVGNGPRVKDLSDYLKSLTVPRAKRIQILLVALKYLARYPELEELRAQIIAEIVAPGLAANR